MWRAPRGWTTSRARGSRRIISPAPAGVVEVDVGHDHVVDRLGAEALRLERRRARPGTEKVVPTSTKAARPFSTRRWLASKKGRTKPVSIAVMPWPRSSEAGGWRRPCAHCAPGACAVTRRGSGPDPG